MAVTISAVLKENSQNIPGNKSNVTIEVYATSTNGAYNTLSPQGTITFSGNKTGSETFTHPFAANKTTCIFINSYDISHSADGTAKIGVNVSFATGTSSGTVTCSYDFTLTPIPRASMPSINSGRFIPGGQLEILTNRKSYEYAHKFTAYCDSDTASGGTYSFGTLATNVGPGFTWTIPESITQHFTTSLNTTVYLTCETYKNNVEAQNYVGSNTISFGVYLSTADIPAFTSYSVTDGNGYLNRFGAFVCGKSKVVVNAAASSPDGTPITTYRAYLDGLLKEDSKTPLVLGIAPKTGNREVGIRAIDQRGRSIRGTKAITVVDYSGPNINLYAFRASSSTTTSVEDDEGTYIRLHVTGNTYNINNKGTNTGTVVVRYKRSDTTSWTTLNSANRGMSWDFWLTISGASASYEYDIEVKVTDQIQGSYTTTTTVGSAQPILDFKSGGSGMGIFSVADRDGIIFGKNIYFRPNDESFSSGDVANAYFLRNGSPTNIFRMQYDSTYGSTFQILARLIATNAYIDKIYQSVVPGLTMVPNLVLDASNGDAYMPNGARVAGGLSVSGGSNLNGATNVNDDLNVKGGLYWPTGSSIGGNVRQTLWTGKASATGTGYIIVSNNMRYNVFLISLGDENATSGGNTAQKVIAVRQTLNGSTSYIAGIGGCASSNHLNQFIHAVYIQARTANNWTIRAANMFNHNGGGSHDSDADGAYVTKIEGLI